MGPRGTTRSRAVQGLVYCSVGDRGSPPRARHGSPVRRGPRALTVLLVIGLRFVGDRSWVEMRGKTGGWVVWARHARLKIDARLQRRPRDHRRHGHRQRHRQVHGHGQRVRLGRSVLFAARHQQRDVLDRPARARVCSGARGDHRQRSAGAADAQERARATERPIARDFPLTPAPGLGPDPRFQWRRPVYIDDPNGLIRAIAWRRPVSWY